jgi:hypothetical protein
MYVCLEYYMKFYIVHTFDVYVHILYNILYGIEYMTTYEGFDNVFALQNLQTFFFEFSQIVFAPLQNLF